MTLLSSMFDLPYEYIDYKQVIVMQDSEVQNSAGNVRSRDDAAGTGDRLKEDQALSEAVRAEIGDGVGALDGHDDGTAERGQEVVAGAPGGVGERELACGASFPERSGLDLRVGAGEVLDNSVYLFK